MTTKAATSFTPRPVRSGDWKESVFQQMRCGACGHLFEAEMPQNVPMAEWFNASKRIRCPSCGNKKQLFLGQGRTLSEDKLFPHGTTLGRRSELWLENGETGNASLAIHERMTGRPQTKHDLPLDLGDLRRCLLLLSRLPEWSERMGEMADLSPGWSRLAPRWAELAALFFEEAGPDLANYPAERTRALLDEIAGS